MGDLNGKHTKPKWPNQLPFISEYIFAGQDGCVLQSAHVYCLPNELPFVWTSLVWLFHWQTSVSFGVCLFSPK